MIVADVLFAFGDGQEKSPASAGGWNRPRYRRRRPFQAQSAAVLTWAMNAALSFWASREHVFVVCGLIDAVCDYRRGLHQVFRNRVIISVHAGVMRDAVVIERILNELETGDAHGIERQMKMPR